MKRFLIFGFDINQKKGGFNDLLCDVEYHEETTQVIKDRFPDYDCYQVVDTLDFQVISFTCEQLFEVK